jgi:hypothetical protein
VTCPANVIVRVWMNFNGPQAITQQYDISAVMHVTEELIAK